MTKFEAIRCISGIKEFSNIVFELVKKSETSENLEKELGKEISKEELQTLEPIAENGNYPLSLEGIQNGIGKYEKAGKEAIEEGSLHFTNNEELARLSLKVLDTIAMNSELPVKYAIDVLEDAKDMLMQLLGI